MTTKEWTEQFPEALLQDERILSAREKELLANVLRQARSVDKVPGNKIAETMARAIGETVMQRACLVLGEGVLRGLESRASESVEFRLGTGPLPVPSPPSPDKPGPRPPSPDPPVNPNAYSVRRNENTVAPFVGPHPPKGIYASDSDNRVAPFVGPEPPNASSLLTEASSVATAEVEDILPANCVVFEEFLVPADLDALMRYTLEHEGDFRISQVLSPGIKGGQVDHDHRRSRVLSEPGAIVRTLVDRVKACLPRVLPKLGVRPFTVVGEEAQITASNHGDFFRWHSDNAQAEIASRELTFVYFFHREPRRFQGGELRIYDSERREGVYVPSGDYRAVVPRQNQIVFFRSSLAHEITPIECASGEFGDSRFTVNGWFHR